MPLVPPLPLPEPPLPPVPVPPLDAPVPAPPLGALVPEPPLEDPLPDPAPPEEPAPLEPDAPELPAALDGVLEEDEDVVLVVETLSLATVAAAAPGTVSVGAPEVSGEDPPPPQAARATDAATAGTRLTS